MSTRNAPASTRRAAPPTGTPWIVKWLIAPLAIAIAGYYLVGPHLGKELFGVKGMGKLAPILGQQPPATPPLPATEPSSDAGQFSTKSEVSPPPKTSGPEVDVSVRPDSGSTSTDTTVVKPVVIRHHHRKKKPAPVATEGGVQVSPPDLSPVDEGSNGGIADNRG